MDDLLDFLVGELEEHGASGEDIDEYRDSWPGAYSNDPLPCPICFVDEDEINRLIALPEEDEYEPLKCKGCKTIFYKPVAD